MRALARFVWSEARLHVLLTRCTFCFVFFVFISSLWLRPGAAVATDLSAADFSADLSSDRADVVIDGRVLFRLGSIDEFTAQRRANSVNRRLQVALEVVPLNRSIPVSIAERDRLSTIRVNNSHLLTVTDSDFRMGMTRQEQAEDWETLLEAALAKAQLERSPSYARRVIWRILAALALTLGLYTLLNRLSKNLSRRRRSRFGQFARKRPWLQPVLVCLEWAVVLLFLAHVSELLPAARTARYNTFRFLENAFNSNLLTAGMQSYSLLDIAKLAVLVLLLWLSVRGLVAIVKARFLQPTIPERGVRDAIATLMQFALMGLGLFILLQAWGIDLSALALLASVLGVGLGFGLQDIANNFISGWILLIERSVQVGDLVDVGTLLGRVERIGLRSTQLHTPDGISIILPNHELVQNRVINWSHGQPVSRLQLNLGVAYGSEIKTVHKAVMEAALAHPDVLRYPPPQLRLIEFGESSLNFHLLLWTNDPEDQFDVKSDVYYLLEANFRRHQVELPYPHRDVNVRFSEDLAQSSHLQTLAKSQAGASLDLSAQIPQSSVEKPLPEQADLADLEHSLTAGIPADILTEVTQYSAILKGHKSVAKTELDRLVEQMLRPEGLMIRDRRFRLTWYPDCFVGSEAVDWIVKTQKATRQEAVRLGQRLVDRDVIHHVTYEHGFKDEYLFYRFYKKET